jgi:hypothetical protein
MTTQEKLIKRKQSLLELAEYLQNISQACKINGVSEVGLWGISGPVYFTITRGWVRDQRFSPADPTQATFYDAYEILELSKDKFRYKSFVIGDEYTEKRVSDSFSFPE